MRPSTNTLLASLALAACAIAADDAARVYLFDPIDLPKQAPSSLDPNTARLIFAHRLGISQFHTLQDVSAEALGHINTFGGHQQRLLGQDAQNNQAHSRPLIVVEGVADPEDIISSAADFQTFNIEHAPCSGSNERLLEDFAAEFEQLHPSLHGEESFIKQVLQPLKATTDASSYGPAYLQIQALQRSAMPGSEAYRVATSSISGELKSLLAEAKEQGFPLTIALMPQGSHQRQKRSANPYGEYEKPNYAQHQRKQKEVPLSESSDSLPTQASSGSGATLQPAQSPNLNAAAKPLRGIIPTCFESMDACNSVTRNCTGHGECILKHKATDDEKKACYSCACTKPEVRKNKDGTKKTTNFGGGACQKKDIVMEFWLIAGFTLFLMSVVAMGVGMLYSMGEEELPSVIGAGVSGPKAR
ncbi:hypothetical protein K402DRAFT_345077 [Aulographum hederae CBS 113979]|uniref:Uncharacterized protein n=1 Tax=Aulographum hederae CBS 113979 TaxID=1176131 RepID=A0A6G1HHF8_9PEZI|nr:hypothetical protein K402DRAFT_345077 [Aulographum hederae CBS 113979]